MPNTTVIIFAKAPESGLAKTRLIPALGAAGAADLARRMLDHATEQAVNAKLGPILIATTPDQSHPAFTALADRFNLTLIDQGTGDLGQRMQHTFDTVWHQRNYLDAARHSILLMGSDIPAIDADMLAVAARKLNDCDAVFIPTIDGGYALVGLKKPNPTLFKDLPWSTPAVMQITRERALAAHLQCIELAPVHDIDEPADLPYCTV